MLVTGASSGIGRAVAVACQDAGAHVLLVARREEELLAVARRVDDGDPAARVHVCDLSREEEVDALVADILREYPRLDVIVSCAGRSIRRPARRALEKRDLRRSVAINMVGPATLMLGLLPALGPGSVIVDVSTCSAKPPFGPQWGAYQGSKAGFDAWFTSLGCELAREGIRCASAYLPLTRTPMSAPTYGRLVPMLTPQEAAAAVLRAALRPVRRVAPWWLTPLELAAVSAPRAIDAVLRMATR